MDGCSQMVFCTHLSYTVDREKGGGRKRRGDKKSSLFIAKSGQCCLEEISTVKILLHFVLYNFLAALSDSVVLMVLPL